MTLTGKDKKHMALIVVVIAIAILAGIFTVHTVRKNNEIREMENQLISYQKELFAIDADFADLSGEDSTVSWKDFFDTSSSMALNAAGIAREISGVQLDAPYKSHLYQYAILLKDYFNAGNKLARANFEYSNKIDTLNAFSYFIDEEDLIELEQLKNEAEEANSIYQEAKISKEKSKKFLDKMKNI